MLKKCLSMLLVVAMLLSVLPMGVFADEETTGSDGGDIIISDGEDTDVPGEEEHLVTVTATDRGARADSNEEDYLVLVAVYDMNGSRLLASAMSDEGSAEAKVPDDVASDGVCTAKAFLLEKETLIPVDVSKTVTVGKLNAEEPEEPEEPNPDEKYYHVEKKDGAVWVNGWKFALDPEDEYYVKNFRWPGEVKFDESKVVISAEASFESVAAGVFGAFAKLATLDIGGVKTIGRNAFEANTTLTQVTLRPGIEKICAGAFMGNTDANEVTFKFVGSRAAWEAIDVEEGAFPAKATISLEGGQTIAIYPDVVDESTLEDNEEAFLEEDEKPVSEVTELPETAEAEELPQPTEAEGLPQTEEVEELPELTAEEAAEAGYYVAPEGARMEEGAVLNEMAAFTGKTVVDKYMVRTSTFSGLLPGEPYLLAVSKSTDSRNTLSEVVEPQNLVFADVKNALSDGTVSFQYYQMTTGEAVIVQLYGLPNTRSVTIVDQDGNAADNLTLKQGDRFQLLAKVVPEQWQSDVKWDVTPANYVTVTDGLVEAQNAGTAYVTATVTHGAYSFSASCRVRVVNDLAEKVTAVNILQPSITTELFRTEGTMIHIAPEFSEREAAENSDDVSENALFADDGDDSDDTMEAAGSLIKSAVFGTDKDDEKERANAKLLNDLFELKVVDDWTLRLVPTKEAVDIALEKSSAIKSKYVGKILLTLDDGEILTGQALTINVKKSTPKLTASSVAINTFYDQKTWALNIKGATVIENSISAAANKKFPGWLGISSNDLTPNIQAGDHRSYSATVYLSVDTEEWAIPATVAVGVKMSYKAPNLRLSSKAITLSSMNSMGTSIYLQSADKTKKLEDMFIEAVELDDEDGRIANYSYDKASGKLILEPSASLSKGTVYVNVYIKDATNPLVLPLQIKTVAPVAHLQKTSVSMNTKWGDEAKIKVYMTPADAKLPDVEKLFVKDLKEKQDVSEELDVEFSQEEDGSYLIVRTDATSNPARYRDTYRVHLKLKGQKDLVLAVKILKPTTNATLSMKLSGTLDLTYPGKGITLARTYKNIVSPDEEAFSLKVNGKPVVFGDYLEEKNGKFFLKDTSEQEDVVDLKAGDRLSITCEGKIDVGEDELVTACAATANITLKRTLVSMKLSKTGVTLNKNMNESAKITYSYAPGGNDVKKDVEPELIVTDNRGNQVDKDNNPICDQLDIKLNKAARTITVQTNEKSVYGGIYRIQMRANAGTKDRLVTLTVKVATKPNSQVTYSASIAGTLDPIRDSSKVTLKYTVRNYVDTAPVVKIVNAANTAENFTDSFDLVPNTKAAGQIFISKKPGVVLDPSIKYQVIVDCGQREVLEDAVIKAGTTTLRVKASKATVKTDRTVTIYEKDRNATYQFAVTSTDKKLNKVEKLTVKNSNIYKIIPLGEGRFEISVIGENVPKSGNLTLNFFVKGMKIQKDAKGNEIPNGTVTLKIVVKK